MTDYELTREHFARMCEEEAGPSDGDTWSAGWQAAAERLSDRIRSTPPEAIEGLSEGRDAARYRYLLGSRNYGSQLLQQRRDYELEANSASWERQADERAKDAHEYLQRAEAAESARREAERALCESIIATQKGSSGRMVCDVETLLHEYNHRKRALPPAPKGSQG